MNDPAKNQPAFVLLRRPEDQTQLALIEMILQREGVTYYVENELGSFGEPPPGLVCPKRVMIQSDRAEECARLLREELELG